MSPMLTMVGHCRQDNRIYKCTKLHDHSSNRKWDFIDLRAHAILFDIPGGDAFPLKFQKKNYIFFELMGTFT